MANYPDEHGFPTPQDDFAASNPFASPTAQEADGYVTPPGEPLTPWISMWTKPRETVRQQLETDPQQYVLLLAILGGIAGAFDDANFLEGELVERLATLVGYIFGGAIGGVVWLYVFGWLVGMSGRAIGGVANAASVRTALAWSNIPMIWMLPLTLAIATTMAVMGADAFMDELRRVQDGVNVFDVSMLPIWFFALAAVYLMVWIWQIVISCKAVGEAHEFSAWGGLAALVLATLAVVAAVLVLVLVVVGILGAFGVGFF